MINQAVILAGGRGTRLGKLCDSTPKPLLEVAGVPFLEHLVWNLRRYGIREILFSVGYLAQHVQAHFGDGTRFGIKCSYAIEYTPAGTGGALLLARDQLSDTFLVLNGDTLFDINFLDLGLVHSKNNALATLALRRVEDAGRYGRITLEGNTVTAFKEKDTTGAGLINGGIYLLEKIALDLLPGSPASLEQDLFPMLAQKGLAAGKQYTGFFIDIGLPETLQNSNTLIPKWKRKQAVFFDRDGVLNVDHGYVHQPKDFEWIAGAREAVKLVNDKGYYAFIVTNQAGIGRGYYTEDNFLAFSHWINEELRKTGAHIDATYYCPHHPEAGIGEYKRRCTCRKPGSGMLAQACKEWDVDLQRSVMIGDKEKDMQAAEGASLQGVLFKRNNLFTFIKDTLN